MESIRGLAALLIVFFHLPGWNPLWFEIGFIRQGYLMVDLFFVLSGFVIYKSYAQNISQGSQLARFLFLRVGRLYPVHLLFLLLFLGTKIVKYFAMTRLGFVPQHSAVFEEGSGIAFIQQLFLVHAIGPTGHAYTFNVPAWSISVEFYTYILFALIVLFANRIKVVLFAIVGSLSLLILIKGSSLGFSELLRCFAGFSIGCLTAAVSKCLDTRFNSFAPLLPLAALFIFVHFNSGPTYEAVIYFLTSALILSIVLSGDGFVKKLLNRPYLTWLGTISYSVYMSHSLVLWAAKQMWLVIFKRPVAVVEGIITPQLSVIESAMTNIVIICAVLLLSHLTYSFIEKPFRARSRKVVFVG